jgi:hypothetical protein
MLLISVLSCATSGSCVVCSLSSRNERNRYTKLWYLIYSSIRRHLRFVTNKRSRYSDGLRAGRPEFESQQGKDFSLLHNVQSGRGAHPTSYPMGTGAISLGVKPPGCGADHSPPSSAEVKNVGAIPPLLHMSSWHSA